MKFIDEARIEVIAGDGGNGVASFCREKFRPFGGPDGGDGGKGGSIYAVGDRNINTLVDFRFSKLHKAKDGENGRGADCYGKGADDIHLRMPVGTLIIDRNTDELIADITEHGQEVLLARGGEGEPYFQRRTCRSQLGRQQCGAWDRIPFQAVNEP